MVEIPVIHSQWDAPDYTSTRRGAMFRAALQLQGLPPADPLVAEFEDAYCLGGSFVDIDRRIKGSPTAEIRAVSMRWRIAMIYTANSIELSFRRQRERVAMYPRQAASMPYWRVRMITDECKRSPHNWLDGFAARWNDQIWKVLAPPFGWECACLINPVLYSDLPCGLEPLKPGVERVPRAVLKAAAGWMARMPSYLWNKSAVPERPYIPADEWVTDPVLLGPTEDQRAFLKKLGISIELTHSDS